MVQMLNFWVIHSAILKVLTDVSGEHTSPVCSLESSVNTSDITRSINPEDLHFCSSTFYLYLSLTVETVSEKAG